MIGVTLFGIFMTPVLPRRSLGERTKAKSARTHREDSPVAGGDKPNEESGRPELTRAMEPIDR